MVDPNDPGAGDPWSIGDAASQRSVKAIEIATLSRVIEAAASAASGAAWSGAGSRAFQAAIAESSPDLAVLTESLSATAAALASYASVVRQIKDQQVELERRRARLRTELDELSAARWRASIADHAPPISFDEPAVRAELIDGEIRATNSRLSQVQEEWDALVLRRAVADAEVISALRSRDVRGNLYEFANASTSSVSTPDLLHVLGTMSQSELRALTTAHPDLVDSLHEASWEVVARWWAGMGDGTSELSHQQYALIAGIPALVGSLGGLPPVVRVLANRFNVTTRLSEIARRVTDLSTPNPRGGRHTMTGAKNAELERLRLERQYLERVVAGAVQLYLYEPHEQSIVEMVGTPGATTTDMVTYVPGTFTSLQNFYTPEGVQDVAEFLNANDANIVTFVWKQGPFPGEDPTTGGVNLFRIGEANDEAVALTAGARIARFQDEVQASSDVLAHADHNAAGHSWGLAAIASSEVKGAEYDQVHSLAGAGMPSGWTANPGTSYSHWAYTDVLTMAQETGLVWGGNIPAESSAFTSTVFEREGDFELYPPSPTTPGGVTAAQVSPAPIPASTRAVDNHTLIATKRDENWSALHDILRELQK